MKKLTIFILAVVALTGCSIYGKYKEEVTEENEVKVMGYREVFTDPQLQALIDTALARNYDLKMSHEHVKQAEATLLGAKLAYVPSIYAAPSVNYSNASLSYGFAQASWEIDIFGRLTNRKRIAEAALKQSRDYEQAARSELIAAVAQTYYTLLMLDAQIITNDSAELYWSRSVETMKEMKEAAMTDEAAVAQFEGAYYSTKANGNALRLSRITAENSMRLLLSSDKAVITRGSLKDQTINETLATVNLQALKSRPDVRAAEHQLEQAFYGVNLARANCCPNITLSGNIGLNGGFIFQAVGSLLQPIFNSGKNIMEVRISKSQLEEMQWGYANALLKAGTEVNNALASKKYHALMTNDYISQVQAMNRALDATETKMHLGSGTYLEVLTAQNDLLTAQLALIQNQSALMQSQVDLFVALGGR